MADTGALGKIGQLIQFSIKLIIKLTANLALELLKFGAVATILVVVCGAWIVSLVFGIRWSYISSDGNIFYTLCVATGMSVGVVLVLAAVQYLVKDVFKLTDMTIVELLKLCFRGKKGDSIKEKKGDDKNSIKEK